MKNKKTMEEKTQEENATSQARPQQRPEDMIPYIREFLGLMEDKKKVDGEIKRCFQDYKKQRDRLLEKKKPIEDRFRALEDILKTTILQQKLPGVKFKQYIFSLDKKPVFKHPTEKIMDALENNPLEHYDRKTLACIIADAIKKKTRRDSVGQDDPSLLELKIRILS